MNDKEYIEELRGIIENKNNVIEEAERKLGQLRNWRDRLQAENNGLRKKKVSYLHAMLEFQDQFQMKADKRVYDAQQFIEQSESERMQSDDDSENYSITPSNFYQTLHDHAEALMMEAVELINWIPWKGWTQKLGNSWDRSEGNNQLSDEHVKELRNEAVDCLIFTINIFIILGMDTHAIWDIYSEKLDTNEKRLKGGY